MRSPVDEILLCVNCKEQETEIESNEVSEGTQVSPPWTGVDQENTQMDDRLGPFASSSSPQDASMDASDLLAQKMIQGFTLLSKNCPKCHTPLVSKQPEFGPFCVTCQSDVSLETQSHQNKRTFEEKSELPCSSQKQPRPITDTNGTPG
eukprot:g1488.t1